MIDVPSLECRVQMFVSQHISSLARSREAVLAVSGGADSCAMAALLCEARIVDPSRCVAAHFDHRLRGTDSSARDRDAVAALCARYGLRTVEGSWSDPAPGEAAARRARYAFLSDVCRDSGLAAIITGHTADDQVETVLMHALRGAGLRGLAAMAAESVVAEANAPARRAKLLRPLLRVTRAETRAFCEAHALRFADDPTNDDPLFLRNRIRRELLPALECRAPDIRRTLLLLADTSRGAAELLDRLAAPLLLESSAGCVTLSRRRLSALDRLLAAHAYRLALERLLGDAREFDRRHYETMVAASSARTGSRFQLPRHVVLTVDAEAVPLSVGPLLVPAIAPVFERPLPFRGVAGAWMLDISPGCEDSSAAGRAAARRGGPMCPPSAATHASAASRQIVGLHLAEGAVLRGWRPGDRIQLPGGTHKKLQDYYVDRKIPRRDRLAAPVIARGGVVMWTPLAAAGEPFAASEPGQPWTVRWRAAPVTVEPELP